MVRPPPGVSSIATSPAHRLDEPFRDGETEAHPVGRRTIAEPLERLEHARPDRRARSPDRDR